MLELIKRLLDWRPVDLVKPSRLGLLAGAALVGVLSASPAFAAHDIGLFELDTGATCGSVACGAANVKDDPAGKPDDWANVFCTAFPGDSNCAGIGTDSAFVRTFVPDPTGSDEKSFFTGGGSKDEEAIDTTLGANKSWLYDNTNDVIPDKDDISNAFAAAYKNPANNHTIFYFGADRFDTNGSAQMGFWFFRSPVTLGIKPNFVGKHSAGDILVLVDFLQGGQVGQLTVYKVKSVNQGKPTLELVVDKTQADCATVLANDPVCGVINNLAGEDPPWFYTNKDEQSTYQKGALLEAGFDFDVLFPGQKFGCFSSFLAETRSSHSLDAQLKDFALGNFEVCGLEVKKEGDTLSKVSDPADYTITIKNTGQSTLWKKTISDSLLGAITTNGTNVSNPNVLTNTCGASLAPGESCEVTLRRTVQAGDLDPLTNTASVTYTENQDFSGVALARTSNHDVNLFQPSITLSKTVLTDALFQGDTAQYTLKLTNTSSSDTPKLDCTITDTNLVINKSVSDLGPNEFVTLNPTFTFNPIPPWCGDEPNPNTGLFDCTNKASVLCTPQGFTNQLTAEAQVTVHVQPATPELQVTKTGPTFSKLGDKPTYTIKITNTGNDDVTLTGIKDTLLGDLLSQCPDKQLSPGEVCTFNVDYTVKDGDPDPLLNTVLVAGTDIFSTPVTANASWSVDLLHPDFTVTKDCGSPQPVPAGASANFRINITNTGDPELLLAISDPSLNVNQNVELAVKSASCTYDSDPADGCYQIEGGIIATGTEVSNTVDVTATLPADFKLSNVISKSDDATCTVQQGGAARTPGFWKTHGGLDGYTCHVFEQHLSGNASLGWKTLTSCEDVLGVFWANVAKNSDGSKRSQICQATEQASFQLLAALLNQGLDNGAPVPIDPKSGLDIITAEQNALSACYDNDAATACDRNNILRLKGLLGDFNSSGDDTAIIDNDGTVIKHADPKDSHSIANTSVADCTSK